MTANVLLTSAEMGRADALAVAGGVPSLELMEAAGGAVARLIQERWRRQPVVVLCGPGNNGGDGFVIARRLKEASWAVTVALLGETAALKGDALANAGRWKGPIKSVTPAVLDGQMLVVDALFGAGLQRPLGGEAKAVVEAIGARGLDCVAVDLPSGVDGDTGQVLGAAPQARLTVTFFRRKPGHLLYPGRGLCGETVVAEIGIPERVLQEIGSRTVANGPDLWLDKFPWPKAEGHKFSRGELVVMGGARMTGAARLAARGARRAGVGLACIGCPPESFAIYAGDQPGNLIKPIKNQSDFIDLMSDSRSNAVLLGPGAESGTRDYVLAALAAGKRCVLDAHALTVFAGSAPDLFKAIQGPVVLTPHEGEFARLFDLTGGKLSRARAAAKASGAVVLLKGADTVIAAPNGRAAINANAPPELATAGSGDVLAGIIAGLLAQGMDAFEAAAAGAWLHGAAGAAVGPGLIAEDIPEALPAVLRTLKEGA
jgi:hydroxyethylthiazole kinase-like uncharacterized protein yjeF